MNEQLEFLKEITRRLDSAGIPYMLTGSMALALYTRPRMTRDIDIVIQCRPPDSETMVELFETDCYVDEQEVRDAITSRTMFNIIHNEWIIKADFIVRKNNKYRRLEFDRRRQFTIEGESIWVVSPEDLILSKLCWVKDGNSELQREDVRAMLQTGRDLEWKYIKKWAEDLGVRELLLEMRE
ncbi:MAG TPA: nucleotidyl transferase AbiEii/AbiGii toxin family protein [Candidatus Krumholzibacteriaceae bacterium]|nr:nucleotidyl transferase AbiEii/AbiGii toxin family protein [Candidatus Krumholzibacteriaceae bacterium]